MPYVNTVQCVALIAPYLRGEYDTGGNLIQETAWVGDLPVATLRPNGGLYYVNPDELGSPRVVTNTSNQPVWRWDSDAFGNGAPNEDPRGTGTLFSYNLRFPGQYYDKESGLHYNYFRDYDPATGRSEHLISRILIETV